MLQLQLAISLVQIEYFRLQRRRGLRMADPITVKKYAHQSIPPAGLLDTLPGQQRIVRARWTMIDDQDMHTRILTKP